MSSDEARRLDEMLRAVMEAENRRAQGMPEELLEDFPEPPAEEEPIEELLGMPEEPLEDFPEPPAEETAAEVQDGLPEMPMEDFQEQPAEEEAIEELSGPQEMLPEQPAEETLMEELVEMSEEPLEDFQEMPLEELGLGEMQGLSLEDFSEQSVEESPLGELGGMPEMSLNDVPEMPEEELGGLPETPAEDLPEMPEEELGGMPDFPLEDFLEMPMEEAPLDELPEMPMEEAPLDELPEMPMEEAPLDELPEMPMDDFPDMPEQTLEEQVPEAEKMAVDPLEFLSMSEEEIDKVLEGDGTPVDTFSENAKGEELSELLEGNDDLADIQELLQMSDDHVMVDDSGTGEEMSFGSAEEGDLLGAIPDVEEDSLADPEAEPTKGKGRQKKEKKKKEKKDSGEGKEGLGKRLAEFFFGQDDDELEEEAVKEKGKGKGKGKGKEQSEDGGEAEEGKGKGKKKKGKKEKPPKKEKEKDPEKEAKQKLKREKRAEKAKLRAEKAAKAEKERRAEKKLPKKKVFVWVLLCASIGAGIMLVNNIGMAALRLTDARNAFEEKDFATAYKLLNEREKLSEEDQLLFAQSSAVLHLQHAKEAYRNHLMLSRPVKALEDLMIGVGKYQELLRTGADNLVTPDLAAEYQSILSILQEQYGLPEEGALEINALESDYEFSLQLEALVRGEGYQGKVETPQADLQQTETPEQLPELEDVLPEEEEYLNGNSN